MTTPTNQDNILATSVNRYLPFVHPDLNAALRKIGNNIEVPISFGNMKYISFWGKELLEDGKHKYQSDWIAQGHADILPSLPLYIAVMSAINADPTTNTELKNLLHADFNKYYMMTGSQFRYCPDAIGHHIGTTAEHHSAVQTQGSDCSLHEVSSEFSQVAFGYPEKIHDIVTTFSKHDKIPKLWRRYDVRSTMIQPVIFGCFSSVFFDMGDNGDGYGKVRPVALALKK